MDNYVPEGAIVVRLNENLIGDHEKELRTRGSIFKTICESNKGQAPYTKGGAIYMGDWRYATALEMYCFRYCKITNINEIQPHHQQLFKDYFQSKSGSNNIAIGILTNQNDNQNVKRENDVHSVTTTNQHGVRPTAIGIRKPTKQIAIGIRPIGNATKGKSVKKRIERITLTAKPIKF
jgi:hypothetical protein